MQRARPSLRAGFRVAISNRRAQAAVMVLAAEGSEGGQGNRHRGADQWLYVLEGRGLLKTLNVYVPPAYSADGEELSPGKP